MQAASAYAIACEQAPSPPATLAQRLQLLRQQHRLGWRCLRTALSFSDLAHLARRLHLSRDALSALLSVLSAQLGAQHLQLEGTQVRLSEELRGAVETLIAGPSRPQS